MTYQEFKAAYENAFKKMMAYKPDEIGSQFYAEEMAKLSDAYPDFELQLEEEAA